MVLFYISFAAGVLAGLGNWRGTTVSSDTLAVTPVQEFNPGVGGSSSPSGSTYGTPSGSWVNMEPNTFEIIPVQDAVNNQIQDGTFTEQAAWLSYDLDTQNTGWMSWTSYVNQMAGLGIDFSSFSAPPNSSTPPPTGSGYNPGWTPGGGSGL